MSSWGPQANERDRRKWKRVDINNEFFTKYHKKQIIYRAFQSESISGLGLYERIIITLNIYKTFIRIHILMQYSSDLIEWNKTQSRETIPNEFIGDLVEMLNEMKFRNILQ